MNHSNKIYIVHDYVWVNGYYIIILPYKKSEQSNYIIGDSFLFVFCPTNTWTPIVRVVMVVIFCVEVATMLWVASFGGALQGGIGHLFGFDDKAMHFFAFALLTMTALSLWCPAWAMMLALVVLAVAVEIMQSVIPAREASFGDFIASSAGIVIATVVWRMGAAFWPLLRNDSDVS